MARYDRRTARLLAAIEEPGAAVPERLDGDDLVHFDFHPENVLVDASGSVTGVVDWSIREIGPDAVSIWLDVAGELMP
jgi:Ser/Thr protein kinase RdoA (MazF antagonist)